MLMTSNRFARIYSRQPKFWPMRCLIAALYLVIIPTVLTQGPIPIPASVLSSPGPLCGEIQGYTPQVSVRCADGLSLTHVLAIPGIAHDRHPLLPGVVWAGHGRILAITYTHLLQWTFSAGKAECIGTTLGPNLGPQRIGLFPFRQKAMLVSARGPGAGHKSAIVLSRVSPGITAIQQWNRLPGEACGIRVGAGGRVVFPLVCLPASGDWIGTLPYDAVAGDRLVVRPLGQGAAPPKAPLLFEQRNMAFAAADGKYCGWVSQGHWARLLAMGKNLGAVTRIHVIGPDLQYGALSPHGRQLALIAYGPATLIGSQILLELLKTHNPKQEKLFAIARDFPTNRAPACPPAFSSDGRLVAAATIRRTSHFPGEVLIVDAAAPESYCKARFGIDTPVSLAFSPGGRHLAVECWYRIFVFRLPKGFPPQRGAASGGNWKHAFFSRVETVTIPPK